MRDSPYVLAIDGQEYRVDYDPAESTSACSAATPTGAARCGFPSISC